MPGILHLPGELIRHTGGFLCWLDRTALSRCCRGLLTSFQRSSDTDRALVGNAGFRAEVVRRLNSEKIDGELFCELLERYKCALTGSFPLQCALGVRWQEVPTDEGISPTVHPLLRPTTESRWGIEEVKRPTTMNFDQIISIDIPRFGDMFVTLGEQKRLPSDIDVFQVGKCDESCLSEFWPPVAHTWPDCHGYPHGFEFVNALMGGKKTSIGNRRWTYDGLEGAQLISHKWNCGDTILNVVTLGPRREETDRTALKHHIESSFDFAFVKLAFDGQRLAIYDWESLVGRECTVDAYSDVRAKHELFGGLGSIHSTLDRSLQVLNERVEKYRGRGFIIELRKLDWLDLVYDSRYSPP